ncbi:MAG: GNAT family N-acetyltransferase [Deltaproteobacteria bacterium]|nr:GNAT family N-acetyltransferase [Deltaproteobacteria bacterium]
MINKRARKVAEELITIDPAKESDLDSILNLLAACNLPSEGLSDHIRTAFVARAGKTTIGCAALEIYGKAALLRFVAVAEGYRSQGLGGRLVQTILDGAKEAGITRAYLLTETAVRYFSRFGFRPIDRSKVPPDVQNSVEFTSVCPVSALAMELRLGE